MRAEMPASFDAEEFIKASRLLDAFTVDQRRRLIALRESVGEGRTNELGPEECRMEFARWLVKNNKLTDSTDNAHITNHQRIGLPEEPLPDLSPPSFIHIKDAKSSITNLFKQTSGKMRNDEYGKEKDGNYIWRGSRIEAPNMVADLFNGQTALTIIYRAQEQRVDAACRTKFCEEGKATEIRIALYADGNFMYQIGDNLKPSISFELDNGRETVDTNHIGLVEKILSMYLNDSLHPSKIR